MEYNIVSLIFNVQVNWESPVKYKELFFFKTRTSELETREKGGG